MEKQINKLETLIVFKDEASKTIKNVEKEFDNLNEKIKDFPNITVKAEEGVFSLSKSMLNLSNIFNITTIGKFLDEVIKLTKFTLKASSNMSELDKVTKQIFGNLSTDVETFAKNISSEMGRSIYSVKKNISDMGIVLKDLGGFDSTTIKNMSEELAILAVDMGSFKNIDDSQAFNALKEGIVGETESLKKMGITLDDMVMAEYAHNKGIKEKWDILDTTTKAQLRYQAIMEKTSFMQGDAAKTIDSYANQLKAFDGNINNLAVTIGNKLMPVANKYLKGINDIISATNDWLNKKDVSDYIELFVEQKNKIYDLYEEYVSLSKITNRTNDQEQKRLDIFNELLNKYPEIFKNISSEADKYKEVGNAIDDVISKLKNKILLQFEEEKIVKLKKDIEPSKKNIEKLKKQNKESTNKLEIIVGKKGFDKNKILENKKLQEASEKMFMYSGYNSYGVNEDNYYSKNFKEELAKIGLKNLSKTELDTIAETFYNVKTKNEPYINAYQKQIQDIINKHQEEMKSEREIIDDAFNALDNASKNQRKDIEKNAEKSLADIKVDLDLNKQNLEVANEEFKVLEKDFKKNKATKLEYLKAKLKVEDLELKDLQLMSQYHQTTMYDNQIKAKRQEIKKTKNNLDKLNPDSEETIKNISDTINDDLKKMGERFKLKTSQQELKLKDITDVSKQIEIAKSNIKNNLIEYISEIKNNLKDNKINLSGFDKVKDINSLETFLKTTDITKLNSNQKIYFEYLMNLYVKGNSGLEVLKNKQEKYTEEIKSKISKLNKELNDFDIKQELLNLDNDDQKNNFQERSNKAKNSFTEKMKKIVDESDSDSEFYGLKDLGVENIKKFLINTGKNYDELSDLDKKKVEQARKILQDYIVTQKKITDEEKEKKIKAANVAMSTINQFLNELANLFPENSELKKSIKKIGGFIGDIGNLGIGIGKAVTGDAQGIQQAIQGAISLFFKVTGEIVNAFKDFSKEVEEEFNKRSELNQNISNFYNLRNAIQDLTDTIIESTARLATDINIAQNKEIFKELNKVYTNKGIEQDVVVNGSYFRQRQGNWFDRLLLGIVTLGLNEIIPLKNAEFKETFKLNDFVDLKGKNSKELRDLYNKTSDKELEEAIYNKAEKAVRDKYNWSNFTKTEIRAFKTNTKELKAKWLEYIKQVEEQEKQLENFNKNVIKESLDGISVVDVNKEKKQYLEYFKKIITDEKEYNKILPELESKVDEMLKSKEEIVTAFNEVRESAINQLASGNDTLSSLTNGMQSYFNKIRNNIAKIQLDSENGGILNGLDEELKNKFKNLSNELVRVRIEGKKLSEVNEDVFNFKDIFEKIKKLKDINNETLEIVKKLRQQAIDKGISVDVVDAFLPLEEVEKRSKELASMIKQAMSVALDTNSFNQFSMSLGNSLYKNVTESLNQAFIDSNAYKKLVDKFVITPDIQAQFDKAENFKDAYDILKVSQIKVENMLKAQGLDFRSTNANTGEYLGGSLQNKVGMNNFGTLSTSGFTVNVNTTITNHGFLSVDDLTNSLIDKTKAKLNFDKQREV